MNMNHWIKYLCGLLLLMASACADDKGNYDYTELNDLAIRMEDSYTAIAREDFSITPTVTGNPFDASKYTFEWKAYDETGRQEPVVIGTDLNLHGELQLLQGNYRLVLNIKEKESGIYYQQTTSLRVNTPTSLGWLVLCSDNGRVRLDMVSHIKHTDNVYHDLLKGTELEEWRNPYQLVCDARMEEPFYLVAESGCTRLSNTEFQWSESYRLANEFGTGMYTGTVRYLASHFPGKLVVKGNGAVHYCNTLMGDGLFGTVRTNGFYVSPAVGYNAMAEFIVPAFMMWDKNNKRFVVCASEFNTIGFDNVRDLPMSYLPEYGFSTVNEDLFAWPKMSDRMDLVHLENTRYDKNQSGDGVTYAILSKGTQRFLYGIILGNLYGFVDSKYGAAYEKAYYVDLSGCAEIASATQFAFSSLKSYMYYAVEGRVYRVNFSTDTPTVELQFELPAGEKITLMKFYLWQQEDADNRSYDLIVASRDENTGENYLRIYDGFSNEGLFKGAEPVEKYGGFADITDVIYRENIIYRQ